MRVLHISDLHLKEPKGIEVEGIIQRFLGIISENTMKQRIDQIVITGDIRDSRSLISIESAIDVITDITVAANLSDKQCIHLLPGNHDLNRGKSKKIETIRKEYDYSNGTFYNADTDLKVLQNRFNNFFWKLCEQYYNEANPWSDRKNNPHYLRVFGEYAFVCVNSALCCLSNSQDGNLIVGTAYLKRLIDLAVDQNVKRVMFFAHHPIQNLANPEETALNDLLIRYKDVSFSWMCGDAHVSRQNPREYIDLYQVGSLTIKKELIPDFAIYDVSDDEISRRVFRFLGHLNNPAKPGRTTGGWKRVNIDPKAPSLYYDETLD